MALKFIDRVKLSRDTNDRVEREIQYLKLLRHPHIIKLYVQYHCVTHSRHDVIQTQAHIIMVIEYAGNELFDYIVKHGKVPSIPIHSDSIAIRERRSTFLPTNHVRR